MDTPSHYLVALDPSGAAGEAALPLATYAAGVTGSRLTLLVALGGPTARALVEFANAEGITVSAAADRYLDQVAGRIHQDSVVVDRVTIEGRDPAEEILNVIDGSGVTAVAIPLSGGADEPRVLRTLARSTTVPVILVPAA